MVTDRDDRIAQAIGDPGSILPRNDGESITRWSTRAVLAVWDDLPAAQPTVDRDALAKQLHLYHRAYEVQPPCDMCKAQAGALLASGVLTDATQIRAEAWDEALRWVRAQADVTSPEYVLDRIDRAEPFNPHRIAREHAASDREADRG